MFWSTVVLIWILLVWAPLYSIWLGPHGEHIVLCKIVNIIIYGYWFILVAVGISGIFSQLEYRAVALNCVPVFCIDCMFIVHLIKNSTFSEVLFWIFCCSSTYEFISYPMKKSTSKFRESVSCEKLLLIFVVFGIFFIRQLSVVIVMRAEFSAHISGCRNSEALHYEFLNPVYYTVQQMWGMEPQTSHNIDCVLGSLFYIRPCSIW
jgi:hypothetical protein